MLTVLIYVVVVALVAVALFFVASAVFGRGEELEPLPKGTTATALPAAGVTGRDVRALKFQVTLRGYDAHEVDWSLDRLATEIDALRVRVRDLEAQAQSGERSYTGERAEPADSAPTDSETADSETADQ